MRKIIEAIIHCSATTPSMDIGFTEIDSWHKDRGFCSPSGVNCGYHVIIRRNGMMENGRPHEEQGAHCRDGGKNNGTLGICLVGGIDEHGSTDSNFTMSQLEALCMLCADLDIEYPGIVFSGHRDYSAKDCPSFNIQALLGD